MYMSLPKSTFLVPITMQVVKLVYLQASISNAV